MSFFDIKWVDEYIHTYPKIIFDVGSYDGNDGLIFKRQYPNARILSIEADTELYNKMINNSVLNRLEKFNYAVCDVDGIVEFYPNTGKMLKSGSIHKPKQKLLDLYPDMSFGAAMKVPSIRLDSFCKYNDITEIDIIHMDIQSAEYRALIGLGNMRPTMIFLEVSCENEVYYEHGYNKTSVKLSEMGYKLEIKIQGDELWVLNR